MSERRRRENWLGPVAKALTLAAAVLSAGPLACQPQPPADAEPPMSHAKVVALTRADAIISLGERDLAAAKELEAKDPASAERLWKEGQEQLERGRAMKAEAAVMK
jgi:hypothetical protein